jgi:hypothetical protein
MNSGSSRSRRSPAIPGRFDTNDEIRFGPTVVRAVTAARVLLEQNAPNPFNPRTAILFECRQGRSALSFVCATFLALMCGRS